MALLGRFDYEERPRKGAAVLLVVHELSIAMDVRSQVFRPFLRHAGQGPLLAEFDGWRRQMLTKLAELDALSSGVGPRDVMAHEPERIASLMAELRADLQGYDAFEAGTVLPLVESTTSSPALAELGRLAEAADSRAPTHPHPDRPPADERNSLMRAFQAIYDRLRDEMSHPSAVLEGRGEQGP